jgi:hypothetical protein
VKAKASTERSPQGPEKNRVYIAYGTGNEVWFRSWTARNC